MARHKRKLTLQDINRMPTVEIKSAPKETLARFTAAYDKEQQEAADRAKAIAEKPMRDLERQFNRDFADLRKIQQESIFEKPSDALANLPQRPESIEGTPESISAEILAAAQEAFKGLTLTESGRARVIKVLQANPTLDSRQVSVWVAVKELMLDMGVLGVEDGIPEPVAPPGGLEPALVKTVIDPFDNLSTENKEQNRELKRYVGQQWGQEVQASMNRWFDELHERFHFDVYAAPDLEILIHRLGQHCDKRNISPTAASTHATLRKSFSKLGYWLSPDGEPRDLRTSEEIFEDSIENLDLNDREVRQTIRRRQQEFAEQR